MSYKKILIVEGIATSGKSSLISEIIRQLGQDEIRVFSESFTHLPIRHNAKDPHANFFKSLLSEALNAPRCILIFDRLYITAAFRSQSEITTYADSEALLLSHDALTIYLHVDEDALEERIKRSVQKPRMQLDNEHSGESWADHIKSRGKTFAEIAEYYARQQQAHLRLLACSRVKSCIIDATHNNYPEIAQRILAGWYY